MLGVNLVSLSWDWFIWAPRGLFTTVTGSYAVVSRTDNAMKVEIDFVQPHRGAFLYLRTRDGLPAFQSVKITLKTLTPRGDVVFAPVMRERDWADFEPTDWWKEDSPYGSILNSTDYRTYSFPFSAFVPAGYSSDENGRLDPDEVLYMFLKFDTIPPGKPLSEKIVFMIREVILR